MGKLTDIQIRNLVRAGSTVHGVSDGDGLTFTLSSSGTAAWVLRFRFGTRRKELTLGRYPDVTLADARKLATAARKRVNEGTDVAREKQEARADAAAAVTMRELCDEFMRRKVETERRRPEKARDLFDGNIIPALGNLVAREVTDRQIIAMLDRIREGGSLVKRRRKETGPAPSVANHVLRLLKQVFRYGRSRRYLDHNPAAEIGTDAAGGREKARTRALEVGELGTFLQALAGAPINEADALALRIILVTCVRVSELVAAKWDEVDADAGIWSIPAENTKTGQGIAIPLAPQVVGWFRRLHELAGGGEWVLPTRRNQKGRPTINRETLERSLRRVSHGLPPFVIHDFRRTARTHLAGLGVPRDVAERCLNHKLQGVEAVYNRHDYFEERREALQKWAAMLAVLEQGEAWNVLRFRAKAA